MLHQAVCLLLPLTACLVLALDDLPQIEFAATNEMAEGMMVAWVSEELLLLLRLLLQQESSFFALEPAEPAGPPALVWPFELTTVVEAAAIIEGAAAGPALGAAVLAPVQKLLAVLAVVSSHCHYDTTHIMAAPLLLRLRRRTDAAPPAAAAVD